MTKFNIHTKGVIHFIGIGGIGMSGIAELMLNLGYKIQGSDLSINNNIKRLQKKNIKIFFQHKANNINGANAIVYSSAIQKNNPEILKKIAKTWFKKGQKPWNKDKTEVYSKEILEKMSKGRKKHYAEHGSHRKGKHHLEISKQKNRLAHLGKPAWNKGKPMSEDPEMSKHSKIKRRDFLSAAALPIAAAVAPTSLTAQDRASSSAPERVRVGIIGAGPGGMAAAEMLRQRGYQVHVYDRYDRIGGLLIYGIPNFKLEKYIVERRANLLIEAGVEFHMQFEVFSMSVYSWTYLF